MTTSEFSSEFDVLYNNITSNQAPGLNDYEKSVFLTKAQLQLLQEYFNPRIDGANGGFDGSQKRQIDFSKIIKWETLQEDISITDKFDLRSKAYRFPNDVLFAINEQVTSTDDGTIYTIIPINYIDYERLMSKPFKYPQKYHVWRLMTNNLGSTIIEIIGRFFGNNTVYKMRYVRNPKPIILEDLSQYNVSIEGVSNITQCELPEEVHHEILERAVTMAKVVWQGGTMTQYAVASDKKDR